MPPDVALLSTLIGSNYPCLELIFMVPKVFEPLKFDCTQVLISCLVWALAMQLCGSFLRSWLISFESFRSHCIKRLTHCHAFLVIIIKAESNLMS